jgi:hypothetical protein
MELTNYDIQNDNNLQTVSGQARSLMSASRHRTQQRVKSMLTRAAADLKIVA